MAYSDLILADSPVGYWRLADTGATADDIGSGNHDGTYVNSPALADGLLVEDANKAHRFNGSNQYVSIGDFHDFAGVVPFSLEAWVKPELISNNSMRVISKEDDLGGGDINGYTLVVLDSGTLARFLRRGGVGNLTLINTPVGSVPMNTVSHLVATYDGVDMRIYVNGALAAGPTASAFSINDNAGLLSIAAEQGPLNLYKGAIDEAAIYDVVLTATEILEHYVAGLGTFAVLVDWNADGDYGDANENVTLDIQALRTGKGRRGPLGMAQPAFLELQLRNRSGKYSPENGSSPISPNLLPRRPVALWGLGTTVQKLFEGRIDDITIEVAAPTFSIARLNCLDNSHFALGEQGPLFTKQTGLPVLMEPDSGGIGPKTGVAVTEVLDQAGWASGDRAIDAGITEMDWFSLNGQDGLSGLRALTDEELGFCYVDFTTSPPKLVFEGRDHRYKSDHLTSQVTYTDAAGGTYRYAELAPYRMGIENVYNLARVRAAARKAPAASAVFALSIPKDSAGTANPPRLAPGESTIFVASWDNPASGTYLVTFSANSRADGAGNDLASQITKVESNPKAHRYDIKLTNAGPQAAYITALALTVNVRLPEEQPSEYETPDATSQTAYGVRRLPIAPQFIGKALNAKDWGGYAVAAFKNPVPLLELTFRGYNEAIRTEMLSRKLSDRVTIVNTPMGLNDDFFVEGIEHSWTTHEGWTTRMVFSKVEAMNQFMLVEHDPLAKLGAAGIGAVFG